MMIHAQKARVLLATVIGVYSLQAQQVLAADSPSATTVEADNRTVTEKIRERIGVSYFGQLFGPSLDAPINSSGGPVGNVPHTLSGSGTQGASAYLQNDLRLNIKTGTPVTFRAQLRFTMRPWVDPNTDGSLVHPFDFLNPRFGAYSFRQFNPNFSLLAWLWADAPINAGAIKLSLVTNPAALLVPEWRFNASNWYLGGYLMARGWIYSNQQAAAKGGGNTFDGYVAPYVKWNFKGSVSAVGTFEWYPQYSLDSSLPKGGDWTTPPVDVQLALNWEVNSSFWIQPFVQVFPSQLSLRTTMVGTYVGATLF